RRTAPQGRTGSALQPPCSRPCPSPPARPPSPRPAPSPSRESRCAPGSPCPAPAARRRGRGSPRAEGRASAATTRRPRSRPSPPCRCPPVPNPRTAPPPRRWRDPGCQRSAPHGPRPTCPRYSSSPVSSWRHLFQDPQPLIHFIPSDGQRGADPDHVPAAREQEESTPEGFLHDVVALAFRRLLGPPVAHEFQADHQAAAAHVTQRPALLLQVTQALLDV